MSNSYDFKTHRLYLETGLRSGARIETDQKQRNYLINVLRYKDGGRILVFNGLDGEWTAEIKTSGKRKCFLKLLEKVRDQSTLPDLHYLFAPLKHARLDYMVQKAVEMGVGAFRPVITNYTQNMKLNLNRIQLNAIEACEQCGVISIPKLSDPTNLSELIGNWEETDKKRVVIYCDESAERRNPMEQLAELERGPLAVLIGPEGGFSKTERDLLRSQEFVVPVSLGPRIMRADTAAVAALAVVQAGLGDWR